MRRIVTLAAAGLALVGAVALAGCGPKTKNAGVNRDTTTVQNSAQDTSQGSANQAGGSGSTATTGAVDSDLATANSLLSDMDSGLAGGPSEDSD